MAQRDFDSICNAYRAMMKEVEGKTDKEKIDRINQFRSGKL